MTSDRQDQIKVDEGAGFQRRQHIVRDVGAERRELLYKVTQFIWLLFTVLELLIGLRVILKLVAANPGNSFADFIYRYSTPFLQPFFGLTGTPAVQGSVLEVPSLIAMVVYALIGWLIVRLIWLFFYHPTRTMVSTYEKRKVD
jgi:YGGT family protein